MAPTEQAKKHYRANLGRAFERKIPEKSFYSESIADPKDVWERSGIFPDLDSQLFGEDLLDELTTGAEVLGRKQAAEEILEALELMPFIKQHPYYAVRRAKSSGWLLA